MYERKNFARRLLWGSGILTAALMGMGGASVSGQPVDRAPAPLQEDQPVDPQDGPADERDDYVGLVEDGDNTAASPAADESGPKPPDPTLGKGNPSDAQDVPGQASTSEAGDDDELTNLVTSAEATGSPASKLRSALSGNESIRVIATMAVDTQLEADLSKTQVRSQRAAIDEAQADLAGILAGTASKVVTRYEVTPAAVVNVDEAGLEALLADPAVAAVTLDQELQLTLDSSTAVIDSDLLNAAGVRGNNFEGSTTGAYEVAVLDSGVDNDHSAFTGRIVAEACFSATNFCPNGGSSQFGLDAGDNCGYSTQCDHGTHVGGIASGAFYTNGHEGVANGSRIIAVQIGHRSTSCGSGPNPCWRTFFSDMDLAMQHVLNLKNAGRNVASVNLSIGGGGPSNNCDAALPNSQNLMAQLQAANVAVVVAAGNDGFNTGVSQPACLSSALTISATDAADVPAGFTNSGTKTNWWAPGVSVVAPIPTGTNEGSKSGTSMSTPHVAGSFSLLRECVDGNGIPQTNSAVVADLNATGVPVTRNGVTRNRINVLDAATSNVNNNDFAFPEVLPANAAAGFNDFDFTVCSDTEPGEPGPFSLDNGIWYSWTPASTGTATISTEDGGGNVTTFDTSLAVYTGNSLGTLSVVAFDDDSGTGLRSLVTVPVNGGTTYRIKVDGFGAANGLMNLHLQNGPPPTCFGAPATLVGTGLNDVLNGTAGNDVIVALGGNDTINGLVGNDRICGDAGDDTVLGGDGDDIVLGGPGADNINGEFGNDTLVGNAGGGDNDDVGDTIIGAQGDDFIDGWVGDDTLVGNVGNDQLRGEAGIDTAFYGTATSGITASLVTNTATGQGNDTFVAVENLSGSPFDDQLTGDDANNVLLGDKGDDGIDGRNGNDQLLGARGNDRLRGGAGNDAYSGGPG
ncbi:MAG: S8 family serine peptidase, partial [Actinomycetota bacterium]|nr:S8 family serine peptidase [Actinomycetota bacterium]